MVEMMVHYDSPLGFVAFSSKLLDPHVDHVVEL